MCRKACLTNDQTTLKKLLPCSDPLDLVTMDVVHPLQAPENEMATDTLSLSGLVLDASPSRERNKSH